ncbi:unnamed protein product (macronuclear) [Paramecium tetraurelia]|uniref:Trichohyalin-plectin-homology domain-containing protein n=1 Tax=Paramecium tetraurelia TaxID=5888 RepID=A0EA71_PARTE|nr:uncharacterized protein GSPATT00024920001 [Paramecium tetraurelia]CAK92188.1 unnamed protein product [Paramecium tetraurelia]|eukprot:XP_001459585.1 hypothetical protein (macronuclear) [Paramecium tetraurelia strain d4-2]
MSQQLSHQWAGIVQKQMVEKVLNENQQKYDQQQRKQRYKEELETDMKLKQQKKIIQHQQDQQLESQMLETLRQRESKKLKEMEQRKIKQIEISLENLNHLLIRKKMNQERSYQSLLLEQDDIKQERLKEIKSLERIKILKDEESKKLRENYDSVIQQKLNQKQQIKSKLLKVQETDPDQLVQAQRGEGQSYQNELNKQLEEKKRKILEIQAKKQEERLRVEQKIAFEKQKILENKLKDYNMHKQYENENYELSNQRKQIGHSSSLESYNIKLNDVSQQKLPHIYSDNYQAQERNKQLHLLDQNLLKYQKLQQQSLQQEQTYNPNQISNQVLKPQQPVQTPLKTPLSQSSKQSKQSKKSKQLINPLHQEGHGYSQIHQSKTQTPKSKQSKKSLPQPIEITDSSNQQLRPKYKNYNILTGVLHIQ